MVQEVLSRGAHGIALISAIMAADDPERAAREILNFLPGTK
jgi:thiamine monophosphate synthase